MSLAVSNGCDVNLTKLLLFRLGIRFAAIQNSGLEPQLSSRKLQLVLLKKLKNERPEQNQAFDVK